SRAAIVLCTVVAPLLASLAPSRARAQSTAQPGGVRQMSAIGDDSTSRSPFLIDAAKVGATSPQYRARPTRMLVIAFAGGSLLAAPFDRKLEAALQSR